MNMEQLYFLYFVTGKLPVFPLTYLLTSLNLTYLTLTFKFLLPTKLPPCSSRTYYKLFVYLLLCTTKFSRVLISVTVCLPITTA